MVFTAVSTISSDFAGAQGKHSRQEDIVDFAKPRCGFISQQFLREIHVRLTPCAAMLMAIVFSSPAFSQMVIQADMAKLQPQISRDEGGYKSCGIRAVVIAEGEERFVDMYDFSMNVWVAPTTALLKAGKSRTTKGRLKQGKTDREIVMPAPVNFWIALESEGKALMPEKFIAAETKGYILGGADLIQALDIIAATIHGERMQFAIRYKNEPVDIVVSFAANMPDHELKPLKACFVGLGERIKQRRGAMQ